MNKLLLDTISTNPKLRKPGVYKIYLYRENKPITIPRFLKDDVSGLLYIGAAEKTPLYYRLNCFINTINPSKKQNNHSGANKVMNNKSLDKIIKVSSLMFDFILSSKAKMQEKKELKDYFEEFGEVPPLNG